ncbi:sigma-54-dependent transcriptional regulator [Chthonobacter rhizosphaerae]|uniref:sigma-54-dependent transcriptional regulator n=1 Tax=Chthonobacter rhizosphaerae TaxID=2735553 RepID=UPI0015EE3B19|nr:sigma-54 dependent transcriptional regulator [Chthonobacter rhizosphaerae]
MAAAPRSSPALRLLLVDADPAARSVLRAGLEARIARPLMIVEAGEPAAVRAVVGDRTFDAMAVDIGTLGGLPAFEDLVRRSPNVAVYAMGPASDVRDAVASVQAGAADFLEKPLDGAAFARRIERLFTAVEPPAADAFEGLVGKSQAMHTLVDQIARIAPSTAPVFIIGDSGTGKGLVARAVHARSRRRSGPFVLVDCAGDDRADLVGELAAPGGALDKADGGTLVLDEIGRLPEMVQSLLLRVLESGEVGGGADRRKVAPRFVATTNRRPDDVSGPGGLRPDLYFRLAVLPIRMPPLSERRDDVPALCDEFLRRAARDLGVRPPRLAPGAERLLLDRPWPGNVRELRNFCERLATLHDGALVTEDAVADLLATVRTAPVAAAPAAPGRIVVRPLWMEEARIIEEAIEAFGGNVARAAAALEISPSTIYRKRRGWVDDESAAAEAAADPVWPRAGYG